MYYELRGHYQAKRGREQVGYNALAQGYEHQTNDFQLGYDYHVNNNTYVGALVSHSNSDIDYRGNYENNLFRTTGAGVYGSRNNDDGWFADVYYLHNNFQGKNNMKNQYFHSNTFTIQRVKGIALSETWTLTPQAGITYGKLSGNDVFAKGTTLQTHAGASIAGKYPLSGYNHQAIRWSLLLR